MNPEGETNVNGYQLVSQPLEPGDDAVHITLFTDSTGGGLEHVEGDLPLPPWVTWLLRPFGHHTIPRVMAFLLLLEDTIGIAFYIAALVLLQRAFKSNYAPILRVWCITLSALCLFTITLRCTFTLLRAWNVVRREFMSIFIPLNAIITSLWFLGLLFLVFGPSQDSVTHGAVWRLALGHLLVRMLPSVGCLLVVCFFVILIFRNPGFLNALMRRTEGMTEEQLSHLEVMTFSEAINRIRTRFGARVRVKRTREDGSGRRSSSSLTANAEQGAETDGYFLFGGVTGALMNRVTSTANALQRERDLRQAEAPERDSDVIEVHGVCAICFEDYEDRSKVMLMPCDDRHFFHEECVRQWLQQKGTCPTCRAVISEYVTAEGLRKNDSTTATSTAGTTGEETRLLSAVR